MSTCITKKKICIPLIVVDWAVVVVEWAAVDDWAAVDIVPPEKRIMKNMPTLTKKQMRIEDI